MNAKRYYYTDALAAAWMAKHFKMKFELVPHEPNCITFCFCEKEIINHQNMETGDKIYIHSDSIQLLDPDTGDVMIGARLLCNEPFIVDLCMKKNPTELEKRLMNGKIIQRNGKPFFWPEVE